ncbi:hypothetical protein [Helicobacter sp.]|uniref:hypothetical protein n=1 Tax=Helicobacter sp. TaxID=218 RepID=UPI0019B804B8|nr:hypothetical protein [Helicobacter sp.]MBD5164846.1 hypothetical protein [Helicobacter sp.]
MRKFLIVVLIALGAYGAEPVFELSKERDLEDSIVLRYSGKKCQTPQDKIEGCIEVAVHRPKSLDDGDLRELVNMFKEAYRDFLPQRNSVEVNYADVITKTFKDNQVNEIKWELRIEMNAKSRGLKGASESFYVDVFYHTFRKNGKMHGLTEFKHKFRDTLKRLNYDENFYLYFYEGEEISKWLARVNPKECKTKADMKGTCQYQEDKQLTLYINGNEFAKIGNYGRYVEGMDPMLQRINIAEKDINELEEVIERVY